MWFECVIECTKTMAYKKIFSYKLKFRLFQNDKVVFGLMDSSTEQECMFWYTFCALW